MGKLKSKKTCIVCNRDSENIFSCRYKCREENKRELEYYFGRELSLGHLCDRCYRAHYKFKLARKARKDLEDANRAQQQTPTSEDPPEPSQSPASSQSPSSSVQQQLSPPPPQPQPNPVSPPTVHLTLNERESSHAPEFGFSSVIPRSAFHSPLPSTSPMATQPSSLQQSPQPEKSETINTTPTTLARHSSFSVESLCVTTAATTTPLPPEQTATPPLGNVPPMRRRSMEIRFLLSSENESSTTILDPFCAFAPQNRNSTQ